MNAGTETHHPLDVARVHTHVPAEATTRGPFTVVGQNVSWTCARCETVNDMDTNICRVCGASLADTLRPPGPERPARDPGTVAMYSLFLPGAGHAYLGLWGQAIARAVISIWVVGVTLFVSIQGGVAGSAAIAVLFGLAALALWIVAAHDAYREALGDPASVVLRPRYFFYVVLGLLGILILPIILSAVNAVG